MSSLTDLHNFDFTLDEDEFTAASLAFDYDPDQDRWPAGAPGGLGGQWRDTNPIKLDVKSLVEHAWEARNAPSGTKILSGRDSHGSNHDLMSNGDGSISAYNDYADDAHSTFYTKQDLEDWLKMSGIMGGGADVKWHNLKAQEAIVPDISPRKKVKVSSAPDVNSSPELKTSLERLEKITSSDEVATQDITSGQVGTVDIVTTKDGKYVRKVNNNWGVHPAKDIADAEELVSELGIRIGARVPAIERVDETTVNIEFVDGVTAAEYKAHGALDVDGLPDSRNNRMIGLLDLMTINQDRHEGNWMVDDSTDPPTVSGIDHGLSWAQAFVDPLLAKYQPHLLTQVPEDKHVENWMNHVESPFVPNFVPYDELFSRRDIARARSALDAMEPRFNEMGKQRWLATSRRVLDLIEDQINFTLGQQAT